MNDHISNFIKCNSSDFVLQLFEMWNHCDGNRFLFCLATWLVSKLNSFFFCVRDKIYWFTFIGLGYENVDKWKAKVCHMKMIEFGMISSIIDTIEFNIEKFQFGYYCYYLMRHLCGWWYIFSCLKWKIRSKRIVAAMWSLAKSMLLHNVVLVIKKMFNHLELCHFGMNKWRKKSRIWENHRRAYSY